VRFRQQPLATAARENDVTAVRSAGPRPVADAPLEVVDCPTCRSAPSSAYRVLLGYSFRRCRSCGLVYMSPRPQPDRLRALYTEGYFRSDDPTCGYAVYRDDRDAVRDKAQRLLHVLERHCPKGRLLVVGCAYGFTLEVARERAWEVAGIEPAAAVAAAAGRTTGARVETDLFDARFPVGHFHAAVLWDVIEHFPDPRRALEEVRRVLRPDGACSIVTPDLGSLAARVLGRRWEEMQKMPEHVYFFDRRSLRRLLWVAGFQPVAWGTVGKLMTLEETFGRLAPTAPLVWRALLGLVRRLGIAGRTGYFDPRWKLAVVARPQPT
jgi:SAM-dependent methyltransferase